jgi:hexosaminidase
MKIKLLLFLLFLPFIGWSQFRSIIPQPVRAEWYRGAFSLDKSVVVYYPEQEKDWDLAAEYLIYTIEEAVGVRVKKLPTEKLTNREGEKAIVLQISPEVKPEGYFMRVKENGISIKASDATGVFYAIQTLKQLFPTSFFDATTVLPVWKAPTCLIEDYPRFSYRGLHLDVGRHFFPPAFIKRYIDLLAMHKMNRFHWHLTEDQGWRIEIKKYPKLQEVAACRDETLVGHYSNQPHQFDGKQYCAYYTQEEVKEIVEYAKSRFVTIVPEIEMPGHSRAALAAYPNLGCTGGPYKTATKWGVFDEVYCAGNEETFTFLDDVLTEVCALFPGDYVHIGGDECPKGSWEKCPKCQQRIREEGLHDEHELQSYFIKRAEAMLAKHGKKLIGWDEILEGGLAPSATVMSWRGTEGGIAAAKAGHDAIMTPGSHCYLDHYQSDPETEPTAIGGYTTLQKTYSYEPIPEELTEEEAKHILGAQGNVWTEYMQTSDYVEYMAYPRAIALAEVTWSPKNRRDWEDFSSRIILHFQRLDALSVNYARGLYDVHAAFENGLLNLKAASEALEIRYTLDGSAVNPKSPVYTEAIPLEESCTVRAACFQKGTRQGKDMVLEYSKHLASGLPYTLTNKPTHYTGGEEYALTNGITGSDKTWSKWVGITGKDLDPTIDFGKKQGVQSVELHFVNSKGSWIYPPRQIQVYTSDDGKNFTLAAEQKIDAEAMSGRSVETVNLALKNTETRYLRVLASSYGQIPSGMPGEGNGAWLFLDEIIVK